MNRTDALELVELVKALCPGQPMGPGTARAWALVLSGCSVEDASTAARTVYLDRGSDKELGARRLEPDDILREVKRLRAARVAAVEPYVPTSPDLTPREQQLEQRSYYAAAADGRELPAIGQAGTRALALPPDDGRVRRGGELRPVGRLRTGR